jgi:hypothetical protein
MFIIQSGGCAESCIKFAGSSLNVAGDLRSGGNFASLAYAVCTPDEMQSPPYPRPYFRSPAELRQIVEASLQLVFAVGRSLEAQPDRQVRRSEPVADKDVLLPGANIWTPKQKPAD